MTAKNFINYHVLISHSPSCLNRDDMNMQKTAVFGGVNRVRISSQSLKRSMRFNPYYEANFGRSIRTRNLEKVTEEFLKSFANRFSEDVVRLAAAKFVKSDVVASVEGEEGGEDTTQAEEKGLAVAPWVVDEIAVICEAIQEVHEVGLSDDEREKALKRVGKTEGKGKDKRTLTKEDCIAQAIDDKIEKLIAARMDKLRAAAGKALDIALSGRMATAGLMTSVDGALAVAHAITTHAVEPQDVDWFTAVDDLTSDAGETGAGHLNTQQFSSGVFYRYASLNLKQLQVNLGLIKNIKSPETAESRQRALDIARHVFHLLATVVPSAKQQSFAAHNLADFAITSFSDLPISLANAFEQPVKHDYKAAGFLKPSISALTDYWTRIHRAYGLDEQVCAFAVGDGIKLDDKPALDSLKAMEDWIANGGKA